MNNVVTVTELMTYKRCRQLWNFVYRERITPRMESSFFYIGRLVHQTLAEWTLHPEADIEELFMTVLQGEMEDLKARYKDAVGAGMSDEEMEAKLEDTKLPMEMVVNYANYWKTPLPDGYRIIMPEQTCLVDIPDTLHWRCKNNHVNQNDLVNDIVICKICNEPVELISMQLEGTLDGLVEDVITHRLYILERKTYSSRPQDNILQNAEQFVMYCWIIRTLFPDYVIGGVLYDGLWKRSVPPRGKVEADLFYRDLLLKSDYELDKAEENLTKVAKEILVGPAIYPTRVWQGCFDDRDYDRICSAIMKGEDVDAIREEYYMEKPVRWFEAETND